MVYVAGKDRWEVGDQINRGKRTFECAIQFTVVTRNAHDNWNWMYCKIIRRDWDNGPTLINLILDFIKLSYMKYDTKA